MKPRSAPHRSQGGAAVLLLLFALALWMAAAAVGQLTRIRLAHAPAHPVTRDALREAKRALLLWAGRRAASRQPADAPVPPGLLPYPDRNADANYDGLSDCVSRIAYLDNDALRLGRLPYRGWEPPCRQAVAPTGADRLALDALEQRDAANELLWFAGARAVFDQLESGGPAGAAENVYPDLSPGHLMRLRSGWLTVCAADGRLITDQAAFVVIAPGIALPEQRRQGAAPGPEQFLDAHPLHGRVPCHRPAESNADGDTVFIAAAGAGAAPFNDELAYATRQELATEVAVVVAEALARHYLQPYLEASGRFPAAAVTAGGICRPDLSGGRLPGVGGPCSGLGRLPRYLLQREATFLRQIRYATDTGGREARLSFEGCAVEFRLSTAGISYFPRQC